jgi:hypothetical protein
MTKGADKVNRKELQAFYNSNGEAKAMLDHFASRERNRNEMTIDSLRHNLKADGISVSRGAAIRVFRRLEELGCGRFVAGRRGHESRFKWDVGLVAVGQAAAGEAVPIEATPTNAPDEPADDLLEHRFHLRKDLDVPVRLPADLTATEAARLAAFIQTLPFGEAAPAS